MAQYQWQKKPKTIKFDMDGRQVIVGALKGSGTTPLIEAPFKVQEFNELHGTNLKLISHEVADHLLNKTDRWKGFEGAIPFPVETLIAYEEIGKELGREIIFTYHGDRVSILTGEHCGKIGVALAVTDITAEDIQKKGNNDFRIIIPQKRLIVIPDFPSNNSWYGLHPETFVPHGEEKKPFSEGTRYFSRRSKSFVGLFVLSYYSPSSYYPDWLGVYALQEPSQKHGVAVEVSGRDVQVFEEHSVKRSRKYSETRASAVQ